MPPAVIVPDKVYQIDAVGKGADAQVIVNRFFYRPDNTGWTTETLIDYLEIFAEDWKTNILPLISDACYMQRFALSRIEYATWYPFAPKPYYKIFYDEQAQFNVEADTTYKGGAIGNALPTYVTANVSRNCSIPGRGYRGRNGFSQLTEVDTIANGNSLTTAAIAAWNAALQLMKSFEEYGSPSLYMVNVSMKEFAIAHNADPLEDVISFADQVVNFSVRTKTGSQTSRKARN